MEEGEGRGGSCLGLLREGREDYLVGQYCRLLLLSAY